jgi:hypothetical protein
MDIEDFDLSNIPIINIPVSKPRLHLADYTSDLLAGSELAVRYLRNSALFVPSEKLSLIQREILMGHMVRLYKLYGSFHLLMKQGMPEMAWVIARPVVESGIFFEYMLQNCTDQVMLEFVRHSLWEDKKLSSREKEHATPEERARASVFSRKYRERCQRFKVDPSSLTKKDGWKTEDIARRIQNPMRYDLAFRSASSYLHGTLADLEDNHLVLNSERIIPKVNQIHPSHLEGVGAYVLGLAADYLECSTGISNPLIEPIRLLVAWFQLMQEHRRDKLPKAVVM